MPDSRANFAIVGGGIAALWVGHLLKAQGYSVIVLSRTPLGEGQTLASQGVIHGGAKYALGGSTTDSSKALAAMPDRWRDAIDGRGEVDLRGTRMLSECQFLWSLPSVASRVLSFFGSKIMRGQASPLPRDEFPEALRHPDYRGSVFRIDEPVVDPVSLVRTLGESLREETFLADCEPAGGEEGIRHLRCGEEIIEADCYILAAGEGNGSLMEKAGIESPKMQVRPLHQVIVRGDLPDFYSVCIGNGPKPPLVTTTHTDSSGRQVWWIGGDIAEAKGVARSGEEQVAAGRQLLKTTMPWLSFDDMDWFTARANRAEPLTPTGERPPGAFCARRGNVLVCWPTKLALAPDLGDQVLRETEGSVTPRPLSRRPALPGTKTGTPPWDISP